MYLFVDVNNQATSFGTFSLLFALNYDFCDTHDVFVNKIAVLTS